MKVRIDLKKLQISSFPLNRKNALNKVPFYDHLGKITYNPGPDCGTCVLEQDSSL